MKQGICQRVGAFGLVATLSLGGGGLFITRCSPAPAPVTTISAPLPVNAAVIQILNEMRARAGIGAVSESDALDAAAVAHSQDQARRRLMTHTGSNGSNAGRRMTANGFSWRTWGENVAAGQTDDAAVMSAWMNSAPHRANMLNPVFTRVGVAAVTGANGVIYWTMDLAAAR